MHQISETILRGHTLNLFDPISFFRMQEFTVSMWKKIVFARIVLG